MQSLNIAKYEGVLVIAISPEQLSCKYNILFSESDSDGWCVDSNASGEGRDCGDCYHSGNSYGCGNVNGSGEHSGRSHGSGTRSSAKFLTSIVDAITLVPVPIFIVDTVPMVFSDAWEYATNEERKVLIQWFPASQRE